MHWLVTIKVRVAAPAEGRVWVASVEMGLVLAVTIAWTVCYIPAKPHTSLRIWTMMRKAQMIGVGVCQVYVGMTLLQIRITGKLKRANPHISPGNRVHIHPLP